MRSLLALSFLVAGCAVHTDDFLRGERDFIAADDDDDATLPSGEGDGLGPNGDVGIWYWEGPPGPDDIDLAAVSGFIANFRDEIEAGEAGTGGVDFNGPTGPDTCALTMWDAADLVVTGGVPGYTEDLEAGDITLTSPTWSEVIVPGSGNTALQYVLELNPDLEVHFGVPYVISSAGGTFPAFGFTQEFVMPTAIHLLGPAPAVFFEAGPDDLELQWEGGEPDNLIHVELLTNTELTTDNALIQCQMVNDGEFSIPGALLAQLPAGQQVNLLLSQNVEVWEDVDGYPVKLTTSTSAQSIGSTPQ